LFGASGVFVELQSALNKMRNVKPGSQSGFWRAIKERFLSFAMILAIGFLLLISLVISTALAILGKYGSEFLPIPESVLGAINFLVSLAGEIALFALILRHVPQTRIARKPAWIGAAVTALLFTIGKFFIGLYLGKTAISSAYGAAGSLVVVIVWVYYSALIFLFGAEFTYVLDSAGHSRNASG
jgi:membrane protein